MGFDIHITRRDDRTGKGDDITASEWLEYVDGDDELTIVQTKEVLCSLERHLNANGVVARLVKRADRHK